MISLKSKKKIDCSEMPFKRQKTLAERIYRSVVSMALSGFMLFNLSYGCATPQSHVKVDPSRVEIILKEKEIVKKDISNFSDKRCTFELDTKTGIMNVTTYDIVHCNADIIPKINFGEDKIEIRRQDRGVLSGSLCGSKQKIEIKNCAGCRIEIHLINATNGEDNTIYCKYP